MKVIQINSVYNFGSTGKITHDLHQYLLSKGVDSKVYYGRGPQTKAPEVIRLCPDLYGKANSLLSRLHGAPYGGCWLSTARLLRCLKREQPDVVHLQCVNGHFVNIYRLLDWLKREKIPTVLTLHAEFMYTGGCTHGDGCGQWKTGCRNCPDGRRDDRSLLLDRTASSWRKLHQIYRDWKELTIVGCSDWITSRASQSGALQHRRCLTIHNGIDNHAIFYPREGASALIREKYGIPEEKKLVLYVAPAFSTEKGFDLLLRLVEESRGQPLHYLLAGESIPLRMEHVTVVGRVADQHFLARLYSAADALVMCSRRENYPTVCLEAVSCGTPVAGFQVGGVAETIFPGMGGTVPLGDSKGMQDLLQTLIREKSSLRAVKEARGACCKERMAEEYLRLYQSLAGGKHGEDPDPEQLF